MTAEARSLDHEPTWQRGGWRLDRARAIAAAAMLAYAVALAALAPPPVRWFAALVVVDVVLMSLPWRVPRTGRNLPSLLLETGAYLVAPVLALVGALAYRPVWLTTLPQPLWLGAGAVLGCALVVAGGMRLRLLLDGELAFLAGPDRPGHAAALATSSVLSAGCEEVLFRGVVLAAVAEGTTAGGAPWLLATAAALAFVARHHVPPAASARTTARGLATQVIAAAGLLAVTAASGSLYPAVIAHLLNNAPGAVLAVQRGRLGASR